MLLEDDVKELAMTKAVLSFLVDCISAKKLRLRQKGLSVMLFFCFTASQ